MRRIAPLDEQANAKLIVGDELAALRPIENRLNSIVEVAMPTLQNDMRMYSVLSDTVFLPALL